MAILVNDTQLTDTFNTFRINVNTIKNRAADTGLENTFTETQTFSTIRFGDNTEIRSLGDTIPFAIALG
jgi:hypothetical protein